MTSKLYLKLFSFIILFLTFLSSAFADPKIEGKWNMNIDLQNVGYFRTEMNFEAENDNFKAYTREGAINEFANIYSSQMSGMLLTFFKSGSLLKIDDGKVSLTGDEIVLKGSFNSLAGKYSFNGKIINESLSGVMTKNNETVGSLTGSREKYDVHPSGYSSLIYSILDTTTNYIFSLDAVSSDKWISFKDRMLKAAYIIQDDVEMAFAFYYFTQDLSISHYYLTRINIQKNSPQYILGMDAPKNTYEIRDLEKNTGYLKINSFTGSAHEIDSLFSIINGKNYSDLIIDLRNNPGGGLSAGLRTAQYLISEELNGGIFLTRKWFENNSNIPKPEEYGNFISVSEANQGLFIRNIHMLEAVTIIAKPVENRFKGKVYILTNSKTGSACEPLVYALKQNKYATIVGAKTAGGMLTGEMFDLGDGFMLTIPTADFYTSDGKRLEGVGVTPDIETDPASSLEYVLKMIN